MAKRRKKRSSKSSLPMAAKTIAFTEIEEAFFAAGESQPHLEAIAEREADTDRPSLWRRLFARANLAA